jgi:hypothetical protein
LWKQAFLKKRQELLVLLVYQLERVCMQDLFDRNIEQASDFAWAWSLMSA